MTERTSFSGQPLILVVDDEPFARSLLQARLSREGYRVIEAEDGRQAITLFEQQRPAALLLDNMMPGLNGIQACAHIRALPGGADVPILMVTALDEQAMIDAAFNAGATDYLTKPLLWPVLRHRLRLLVRQQESEARLRLQERAMAAASNGIALLESRAEPYTIFYTNRAFAQLFGVASEALVGHEVRHLLAWLEAGDAEALMAAMQRGGEATFTVQARGAATTAFWAEIALSPVRDEQGTVAHYIWIVQEISERIQRDAERSDQLLKEKALVTLTEKLNRSAELETILSTALAQALQVLELELGGIYLVDEGGEALHLMVSQGVSPEFVLSQAELPIVGSLTGRAVLENRSVIVANIGDEVPYLAELAQRMGVVAQVSLPLRAAGAIVGVMNLNASSPISLSERTLALAQAIADQVGVALERARLYEQLREQALRDALTGLFNRRYLEETLQRELSRAARDEQAVSVLMIDADHFKRYNDQFGHDAGDAMLRALGRLLHSHVRSSDVACRYGGEEFTLILTNSSDSSAYRRAQQIHQAVGGLVVPWEGAALPPLSVSIGVASFPTHGSQWEQLLQAADRALYQAKSQGRDCIVVAQPPAAP